MNSLMKNAVSVIASVFLFSACQNQGEDYFLIPSRTPEKNFQAVIEIPAGTNLKIEYDRSQYKFLPDIKEGKDRVIDFLPYPGNYGFIPSTLSEVAEGGDGDPTDVLVLSEHVTTATVMEILPIAIFKLMENDQMDYKIIAVPADKQARTIQAENFREFSEKYPEAKQIIEDWFMNYDPDEKTESRGWGDEKEAVAEIERWAVNK